MHGWTDRIENRWWNVAHTSALGSANACVEWAAANICVLHLDFVRAFLPGRQCRENKKETDIYECALWRQKCT